MQIVYGVDYLYNTIYLCLDHPKSPISKIQSNLILIDGNTRGRFTLFQELCRSSEEDFDADSGKTRSKIFQVSFLNKAAYFPNDHQYPVEQVRNIYLTKPVVMLIRDNVITNRVVTKESSEQCKQTVNAIYNNQTENNNIRFEYAGTVEYASQLEYEDSHHKQRQSAQTSYGRLINQTSKRPNLISLMVLIVQLIQLPMKQLTCLSFIIFNQYSQSLLGQ
ncbi:Hypothetical_protein [Hexamita inflata]|uniref:Hypothetical_protein n=1 Tax=Hexamita inflata TaxID=28002 RepID=A0AA86PQI5_9EUKA|nr:Hypothetical protein HINF_LOCUS26844 [Hexamita inflata]